MKSQIQMQVFAQIMAVVVASAVILTGYKLILSMGTDMKASKLDEFKTDLAGIITASSGEYGSMHKKKLSVPSEFGEICFVNSDLSVDSPLIDSYPLIKDSVDSGAQANIFLIGEEQTDSLFIDQLLVQDGFLCMENRGSIDIKIEGLGNRARIYQ